MVGTIFTKYWYIPAPWDSLSSAFRIPSNGFTIPGSMNTNRHPLLTRKFFSKGKSVHCVAHVKIKVSIWLEVMYVHMVLLETFSRCKVEISSDLSNIIFLARKMSSLPYLQANIHILGILHQLVVVIFQ